MTICVPLNCAVYPFSMLCAIQGVQEGSKFAFASENVATDPTDNQCKIPKTKHAEHNLLQYLLNIMIKKCEFAENYQNFKSLQVQ